MRKLAAIFPCLALILMLSNQANAGPLSGTFNMTGDVTFTASTTTWNSNVPPSASDFFTLSGGTGSFASANGQNGVSNLSFATEPTGALFAAQPFITFTQDPALAGLDINFIGAGTGGTANCNAAPAPGDTCTASSLPFVTFADGPNGTSTMTFAFSGVTSDGLSDWTAIFTSQFNGPYQTALADFGQDGYLVNSYSATVDVTANSITPTPEPATWVLVSTALGLAAFRRKLAR